MAAIHERTNATVKHAESLTTWSGNKRYVRLDLQGDGGHDLHLYVPEQHPFASAKPGARMKLVRE